MSERQHVVILATGGANWLGGRHYAQNLVRSLIAFRGESNAFDISVLVHDQAEISEYESLKGELRTVAGCDRLLAEWTLANRVRWKLKRMFGGALNPRFEEALQTVGATFAYPASVAKLRSADWIPDFQYHFYPDMMQPFEIEERRRQFGIIADQAKWIVLSSAHAEKNCHAVFPATAGRTSVLQFRVFADPNWLTQDCAETVRKYNLPDRFALVSNWMLPTKNRRLVLEALARLSASERQDMQVVFTGDIYDYRNPGFYNDFLNKLHLLGLRRHVFHLGVVPKNDQIQLLRASAFYLQPSLFEGWNTGVEEARMFGKRVLLSNIPVHLEQSPPGAFYFDPTNADELASGLKSLFSMAPADASASAESEALAEYAILQKQFGADLAAIALRDGAVARKPA